MFFDVLSDDTIAISIQWREPVKHRAHFAFFMNITKDYIPEVDSLQLQVTPRSHQGCSKVIAVFHDHP